MAVLVGASLLAASGCKKGVDTEEEIPVDNTPVEHSSISARPPKGCGSGFYSVHYGDAYKTLREAEEYKPGLRDHYVRELSDRRNEYLLAGISASERKDWLTSHKIGEKDQQCLSRFSMSSGPRRSARCRSTGRAGTAMTTQTKRT